MIVGFVFDNGDYYFFEDFVFSGFLLLGIVGDDVIVGFGMVN